MKKCLSLILIVILTSVPVAQAQPKDKTIFLNLVYSSEGQGQKTVTPGGTLMVKTKYDGETVIFSHCSDGCSIIGSAVGYRLSELKNIPFNGTYISSAVILTAAVYALVGLSKSLRSGTVLRPYPIPLPKTIGLGGMAAGTVGLGASNNNSEIALATVLKAIEEGASKPEDTVYIQHEVIITMAAPLGHAPNSYNLSTREVIKHLHELLSSLP